MITASNVDTYTDTFAPYSIREIVRHLRDNLDIDLRWNGLFLCFEVRLPLHRRGLGARVPPLEG